MTLLAQQIILIFLRRRVAPANLPEIMRARGIPARHSRSQYNAARQLVQRLVARGLVAKHRIQGVRQVTFALTPAGARRAGQFEAFLAELDAAREALERALGASSPVTSLDALEVSPGPISGQPRQPTPRKVYECPRCSTAITVDALKGQLQRSKGFTCETCHLEQAEMARDFLESLRESSTSTV